MIGPLRRRAEIFASIITAEDVEGDKGRELPKNSDMDEFDVYPDREPISIGDLRLHVSVDVDGFPACEDDVPAFTERGSMLFRQDSPTDITKAKRLHRRIGQWLDSVGQEL